MNSVTYGGAEVKDLSSVSSVIPRWQDVGSNIVGGRCALFAFAVGLLLLTLCVCVQGKYEFRNFVNTKTTRREVQTKNVLTALGDKEYTVRYSDKTRPAPLPLFRVRRQVKVCVRACTSMSCSLCVSTKAKACVCVCVCVCMCMCLSTPLLHARRFDRKCRDYERAYLCYQTPRALRRATTSGSGTGYQVIKNIIKKVKAHRCTGAIQSKVCQDNEPPPPTELLQTLKL